MALIFFALQLLLAGLFLFLCLSFVTGGPFVPSSKTQSQTMLKLARLKRGMIVYDLGSGDGRLLILAASRGASAIGIEINPYLVLYSKLRAFFSPYRGQVKVFWANLWKTDLSAANVVFVYLLPWKMEALERKLNKELKGGALVVSNSFVFPHLKLVAQDTKHHVYAFRTG